MSFLNRLPGFHRSPPGLEWRLWKRLPLIWLLGTLVPLAYGGLAWWLAPEVEGGATDPKLLLLLARLAGLVMVHWTLVLTVAIGCIVVRIMKGPAYVADPYPPADREQISSLG